MLHNSFALFLGFCLASIFLFIKLYKKIYLFCLNYIYFKESQIENNILELNNLNKQKNELENEIKNLENLECEKIAKEKYLKFYKEDLQFILEKKEAKQKQYYQKLIQTEENKQKIIFIDNIFEELLFNYSNIDDFYLL